LKLLQLVPGFGHIQNGLFDYARVLESELLKKNIVSFYNPKYAKECDAIFLNYSGYGYQKRGLPIGLYLRLRRIVRRKRIHLFIYFHELYAGGTHWRHSSYWLYPLQKKLCHLFLELATVSFCGNEVMFELLRSGSAAGTNKLKYAGLFSNIPVLERNKKSDQREKIAVVFGSAGRREAVYSNLFEIERICSTLGITKIIDIGSGDMSKYRTFANVSVESKGILSGSDTAAVMQSSQFGFLSYVEHLFGKSGIFAAYAGNGMTIINFPTESKTPMDGLIKGVHYMNASDIAIDNTKIENADFSGNIFAWYQSRNAAAHAKIIYDTLVKEM
jgi:hypothetical protein